MAIASIFLPNLLRALTMVLAIVVLVTMPRAVAIATKGHATRFAMLLVLGFELLVLGKFAGMVDRWNQSLIWYGTPLTFIAMLITAIYIYKIFTGVKRGNNANGS
jgi:hypothetical protein